MLEDKGKVDHDRYISKDGNNFIQTDKFTAKISLEHFNDKSSDLLDYWCIEEFDRAYISWKNYELVLEYRTRHYISEAYAFEMLQDPETIDLTADEED